MIDKAAKDLCTEGYHVVGVACDGTNADQVEAMIERAISNMADLTQPSTMQV